MTNHRAAVVVAFAAGDALGARYEGFPWRWPTLAVRPGRTVQLWRRKLYWTDDTEMSLAYLLALDETRGAAAVDVGEEAVLRHLIRWRRKGALLDMGTTTIGVLGKLAAADPAAARAVAAARNSQGNGAMMRSAAVAVTSTSTGHAAVTARRLATLTHASPEAADSAAAAAALIHHAFVSGAIDPAAALAHVSDPSVVAALTRPQRPSLGRRKGWAPATLSAVLWCAQEAQARWSSPDALEPAVRWVVAQGGDCDTNASLVAALLTAARHQPLPSWAAQLYGGGWSGRRFDAAALAELTAKVAPEAGLR